MPVVEAPRDARVNLRLSASASEGVRWLAEALGVSKTTAAAVAVSVGVKTLQKQMAITPAESLQLLTGSGLDQELDDPTPAPAAVPAQPRPLQRGREPQRQPVIKGKKRH